MNLVYEHHKKVDGLKHVLKSVLASIQDINLCVYSMAPYADVWEVSFASKNFIIVNDLDYGIDVRFFDQADQVLAEKLVDMILMKCSSHEHSA